MEVFPTREIPEDNKYLSGASERLANVCGHLDVEIVKCDGCMPVFELRRVGCERILVDLDPPLDGT